MDREAPLYLATVTMRLGEGTVDGVPGDRASAVSEAMMGHPDVVTVRPEYGEELWLYRVDVRAQSPEAARHQAVVPVERISRLVGLDVAVVEVTVMDDAERRRFHRPFYERLAARTGEQLAI